MSIRQCLCVWLSKTSMTSVSHTKLESFNANDLFASLLPLFHGYPIAGYISIESIHQMSHWHIVSPFTWVKDNSQLVPKSANISKKGSIVYDGYSRLHSTLKHRSHWHKLTAALCAASDHVIILTARSSSSCTAHY